MNIKKISLTFTYSVLTVMALASSFFYCMWKEINYETDLGQNFIGQFSFRSLIWWENWGLAFIVFFLCFLLISMLGKRFHHVFRAKACSLKLIHFLIPFFLIGCTWLICFLCYYPGTGMDDTIYIIWNGLGMYQQHPFFYCAFIRGFYQIGLSLFHTPIAAYATITIIQLLLLDLIVSYSVYLVRKFCGKLFYYVYILYFLVIPLIALYSITLVKDTLFAGNILLFICWIKTMIQYHGIFPRQKSFWVFTLLTLWAVASTRNNGFYVIFLTFLLMSIFYHKKDTLIKMLCLLLGVFLLIKIPNFIMSHISTNENLYQETVGIPLQQMAYVIATDGIIEPEEKEYLSQLFDYEEVSSHFNPYTVDAIKWTGILHNDVLIADKSAFWKTYFRLFSHNKGAYIKEWLLSTCGYWSGIDFSYYNQHRFFEVKNKDENIYNKTLLKDTTFEKCNSYYNKHAAYLSGGACLLLCFLYITLLLRSTHRENMLLAIPLLGITGTLFLAAPIALGYRYIIAYAFCLPFMFMAGLINTDLSDNCNNHFKGEPNEITTN